MGRNRKSKPDEYERQMGIEHSCFHRENGKQIPCPPMCPYQSWPKSMFRFTWLTGRYKLKRKYRG